MNVVVVGSGAAGLAAAVAAARGGARVTVLEATSTIGGTTALSGGVAWVPGNHLLAPSVRAADLDGARAYLGELRLGDVDDALVERYLAVAPEVLATLEAATPLRWEPLDYPDYHAGRPGSAERGRSLEPAPLALSAEVDARVRPAGWGVRATQGEIIAGAVTGRRHRERAASRVATMGRALVGGLLAGALDAGVEVRTAARVLGLQLDDGGAVRGVRSTAGVVGGRVVLATGGFERDPDLVRTFLRMPGVVCTGAPGATGDGLRMALSVGAELGNMSEAWWCPAVEVDTGDADRPSAHLLLTERGRPGSLMVDRDGRRFCNEAGNYNDVGRALHAFDPGRFRFSRDPSWLVVDEAFRARHAVGPVRPGTADPPDWVTADDDAGLAASAGLPIATFVSTLAHFNTAARDGRDPDFGRGESAYDRFVGEAGAAHPSLRPLTGRLTAIPVRAGTLGTKGGPRTDGSGRVRRLDGTTVPGLYAAGNVAASPFGLLYPGAGGTIGPALAFGHLAGAAAATDG